jgi:hypothetical protein
MAAIVIVLHLGTAAVPFVSVATPTLVQILTNKVIDWELASISNTLYADLYTLSSKIKQLDPLKNSTLLSSLVTTKYTLVIDYK